MWRDQAYLWQLIDKALAQDQIYKAYEYACDLISSVPQLPDTIKAILLEAIKSWEERHPEITRTHFRQAIKLAKEMGL